MKVVDGTGHTMDRREALKKLGAGAAIAVTVPVVLPSTRVAHAASGGVGDTGLVGVPGNGDVVASYSTAGSGSNRKREVGIVVDNSAVTCVGGDPVVFSIQWRIDSGTFDHRGSKPVRLSVGGAGGEYVTMPFSSASYPGGAYGVVGYESSFELKKIRSDGKQEQLRSNDVWNLTAKCRWHCPGAAEDVVAEYRFSGSSYSAPSVFFESWTDTAAA